jgi:glycosyltransferase involved in cell wall biosynthesis
MRIVIDMQGAQSIGSCDRGIGRYTLAITQAMIRNRGEHDIVLALNGLFPDTIEPIRKAFDALLPQENIRVWNVVAPVAYMDKANGSRRRTGEIIYEAFLSELKPDLICMSSFLFEGWQDDAIASFHQESLCAPVAVVLYDLIPSVFPDLYLRNPDIKSWYFGQIEALQKADLLLTISESTRRDGIKYLGISSEWVVNVSCDADSYFKRIELSGEQEMTLRKKYSLEKPFILFVGGDDQRKNVEGLLRAFALLSDELRETYLLVTVCSLQPEGRHKLERMAWELGLQKQLILTGFVSDEELVALYNLCSLFVFPSWYEGFGLPALEAMRCDAPVIGANTSSVPEVLGWDEALFDPYSEESIAELMQRGLADKDFRAELIQHAQQQAKKFSWDESACSALRAMERAQEHWRAVHIRQTASEKKPKLAYVSPLPPEHTGIANYSAELLPVLAEHYEIEVIIAQDLITDKWINENCPIRSVQWLIENADGYDRVLYHFGNSSFHQHMFTLLEAVPGVIVLHDFYLSNIMYSMDLLGYFPGLWTRELYKAHGYAALRDGFLSEKQEDAVWKYPCSLSVVQNSLGVVVHSPNSLRLAKQWYGDNLYDWAVIPLTREPHLRFDKACARAVLGIGDNDFVIGAFGLLSPHKLNHRLLDAWLHSSLAEDTSCYLVFVGENDHGDYGQALRKKIHDEQGGKRVHITGWAQAEVFHQYLAAIDVGVQLRTLSRGETSAAVLDCMNYGKAVIVNANGSMADLDDEATWKLPDDFSDRQLIEALETLHLDTARRQKMGAAARSVVLTHHDPKFCAKQYREAIERFYQYAPSSISGLSRGIAREVRKTNDGQLIFLASAIAQTFPPRNRQRQLLVDISNIVRADVGTGIPRVVRSVLSEWLNNPPKGYRIETVYATLDQPYRYARRFTAGFMGYLNGIVEDDLVEYWSGDIFFGLDLHTGVVPAHRHTYQAMRCQGVRVKFMLYDMLCMQMPDTFLPEGVGAFAQWLDVVAENDGVICISQSSASDFSKWIKKNAPQREKFLEIDWSHIGADLSNSVPTKGLPVDARAVLTKIRAQPSFLMVGTLEPRKGHAQVLAAFECLWAQNDDSVILAIVGKQGWMMEDFVEGIRHHPEYGKRLIWLEDISDEYLEKVYAASRCLIAASYGEGFGLPLVEAAQHNLPIIARDIPVFREVAGEHAYYFSGLQAEDLSRAVREWLGLFEKGQAPSSCNMSWLTWEQSAQQLLQKILPKESLKASKKNAVTMPSMGGCYQRIVQGAA